MKARTKCLSGPDDCMSMRSGQRDVFVNAAGFVGNQPSVVIVAQLQYPAKLGGGPLSFREKFAGIGAQGAQEFGDFAMMPADEDAFFVMSGGYVRGELPKLAVFELIVDLKMKGLAEWFDGEARAMTSFAVRRGVEGIEQQGFGVNAERLEVRYISFRALVSGGGQIGSGVQFLGMTDNEDDGVFWSAEVCDGGNSFSVRFGEAGDRKTERQQCAG